MNILIILIGCYYIFPFDSSVKTVEEITKPPFTIYFHIEDKLTAEKALDILYIANEELSNRFGIEIGEIRVLLIRESEDFVSITGGHSPFSLGGVAKPSKNIIVVKSPRLRRWGEDFAGTLRHELVHIYLHTAGIADRIPLWFNEGLAMLLANEYYWGTRIRMAQVVLTNQIVDYKDLDTAILINSKHDMKRGSAYVQALSMVQFLYNRLGEDRFWAIVEMCKHKRFPVALKEVAGWTIDDLWLGYRRSLWIVAILGALATGSIFTPIAILVIVVFLIIWRRNQRKIVEWEREEQEENMYSITTIPWENLTQEPYEWEQKDDD